MRTESPHPEATTLRVLHAFKTFTLYSGGGGVERYIDRLLRQFRAAGMAAAVIAPDAQAPPDQAYTAIRGGYGRLWHAVGEADIVHVHGTRVVYSLIAAAFAWVRGKRAFYTAHCFYAGKNAFATLCKWGWDQLAERALFGWFATPIVLSDYWREDAIARGLPVARLHIIPNGVDLAAITAEPSQAADVPGAPSLLCVARLDPVKRLEDPILALREPPLAQAHLHLIGRGADEVRLRAIAADQGLSDRVTFHGFQRDAQVAEIARGADCFIISSAEEGMPTTILEMLARGCRVVASDIPGNRSLMEPLGLAHHCYALGSSAALAETVARACAAPAPQVTEALREQFDWPAIAARMLAIYQGR